ncbi:MAG TPA: Gfo/Idh/MocA family oxidoreductase [Caldilineaceae bacterium]|nr:Gfo/Idh/MocA family oxidoreductase [Caldilineaceae bacterium]
MKTLALVGCAHIHTPGFVKRLQARKDVKVTKVWDHEFARADKWATETGAQTVNDLSAIWSDSTVDGVIICSETNRHQPLVEAAAAAKKHMFVEKPLGIGAADSLAMASAIEEAGVLFQTGYFQRGNPIHLFIREQIQAGHLGKITRVRHSNCHAGSLGGWFDTDWRWMADLEQAGVGGFGDLGTHSLDILMWLLGDVARVTATVDVATGRYGDCDEYGEGLLVFQNGAVATLAAGWVDVAHPVNVIVSGTEGHAYASNGQLYFKSSHVAGADGITPWTELPAEWPHAFELFLDALVGKPDVPLVSPSEAAARSIVMSALYEGANENRWVTIER